MLLKFEHSNTQHFVFFVPDLEKVTQFKVLHWILLDFVYYSSLQPSITESPNKQENNSGQMDRCSPSPIPELPDALNEVLSGDGMDQLCISLPPGDRSPRGTSERRRRDKINLHDFNFIKVLGKGSFGKVSVGNILYLHRSIGQRKLWKGEHG